MWVRLTPPPERLTRATLRAYLRWKMDYLRWRLFSLKRAIQAPATWWRRRKAAKRLNKYLLQEAEKVAKLPPHSPPTTDEVIDFVHWAEHSGLRFAHRVAAMPKSPPNSKEVELTKTGINYGN